MGLVERQPLLPTRRSGSTGPVLGAKKAFMYSCKSCVIVFALTVFILSIPGYMMSKRHALGGGGGRHNSDHFVDKPLPPQLINVVKDSLQQSWCHKGRGYSDASWARWRNILPFAVRTVTDSIMGQGLPPQGEIFQFGVLNGESMRIHRKAFPQTKMWGFDSFRGLPADTPSQQPFWNALGQKNKFKPGEYASEAGMETQRILTKELGNVEFVAGFFNESLTHSLATTRHIQQAFLLDMDADLYVSTYQALDWVFSNGLIMPGTLIAYDDFWVNVCVISERAKKMQLNPLNAGEGLAHKRISEKYGVRFVCVAGSCQRPSLKQPYVDGEGCSSHNSWASVFMVAGFDGPNHGFALTATEIEEFRLRSFDCLDLQHYFQPRN